MKRPRLTSGGLGNRPKKSRGGRTVGRGGGGAGALYQPTTTLSGRKLKRAAKKLTKIELLPALRAYQRQAGLIEAQRAAAESGLSDLGSRTGSAVGGAYDALNASASQTNARATALAGQLNQDTTRINTEAAQNLGAQQTGQLGALTEALSARNVDPGGSASQAALAQQVQAQQQRASENAQARGAFASAQGGAFQGLAQGMAQSGQMQGRAAQASIADMIAQRIAESNIQHRADRSEALGKAADTKALWGPTRLKNILSLRGSEREYDLARNPGVKKNVNVYKGLNKKGGARAQIKVAKEQTKAQGIESAGLKDYGKSVGGGGKRRKPPRRR